MRDTIYRDEAVEICERWRQRAKEHHDRNGWYMADILLRFMKEMPSADRPQGEWIDDGLDGIGTMGVEYRWYKCSKCGFRISKSPFAYYPNFCEACGASMKGVINESID